MFRSGFANASSYRAAGKADRLLRSAVTAFYANPRPTRRETAQFDDLTEPLLETASNETLRFMAATLSQSPYAPPALIRRLSALPVEISAPLLMRSPVLTPIDLLALIARHGLAHARAIAIRPDLDERILRIIHSLETPEEETAPATASPRLEETREHLRTMMQPPQNRSPELSAPSASNRDRTQTTEMRWGDRPDAYLKLRSTALAGMATQFHSALANALAIEPVQARAIAEDSDAARIIVALRALPLSEEEAFLIMQCLRPARDRHGIAAFLEAWQAITQEQAAQVVASWRNTAPDTSALRAS